MTELFQSGRLRHVSWDTQASKIARLCVPSVLDLERLALVENEYTPPASFGSLLRLLAHTQSLKSLRIEQANLSPALMQEIAATHSRWQDYGQLQQLELILSGEAFPMENEAAVYLQQIVKIPQKTLILSFHQHQEDYSIILEYLKKVPLE